MIELRTVGVALLLAATVLGCKGADDPEAAKKRVFVTSAFFTGNLGGVSGADNKCTAAAAAAGLGGSFTAWLSDANTDAIDRIPDVGPWYVVGDTTRVFHDKANLATTPLVPINRSETGAVVEAPPIRASTGTFKGGTRVSDFTCDNWNNPTSGFSALRGSLNSTAGWTDGAIGACSNFARLYCFQR